MINSIEDILNSVSSGKSTRLGEHLPCCVQGGCGSSDAMAVYQNNETKKYSLYCFSCSQVQYKDLTEDFIEEVLTSSKRGYKPVLNKGQKDKMTQEVSKELTQGSYRELADRMIKESVCKKYGVRSLAKKGSGEVVKHIYPYTNVDGKIIAQKLRLVETKDFPWESTEEGFMEKIMLFGQSAFAPGSATKLTITEGEIDAMSAFQMNGQLYPVVSIPAGGGKNVRNIFKNEHVYKWVDSFKEIVISMDMDEQGKTAAKILAEMFPRKAKIMNMRYKDANEYLQKGSSDEWTKDFHNAQGYAPEGLVKSSQLIKPILEGEAIETIAFYPYRTLNRLLMGIRGGELITITAGTGVGKSAFINELAFDIQKQTGKPVGLLCLEQSKTKTAAKLLSLSMNKPIVNMNVLDKIPDYLKDNPMYEDLKDYMKENGADVEVDPKELEEGANKLLGEDKFIIFDHFGSSDIDTIIRKVYQMKTVYDCQTVFLDHISIVVSGQDSGDERKALDAIMTKLRMLVEQTGLCLYVVSHLKRPQGKGHEEGAATSLSELRGTAGIGQLSDAVIGLERNQQHDDPWIRNCTLVRVLKNRMFGETGPASILFYNKATSRLVEIQQEDYDAHIRENEKKEKDLKRDEEWNKGSKTDYGSVIEID